MEANFIDLVNDSYMTEPETSWADDAAIWIADTATTIEESVVNTTVAVAAHFVRNTTLIVKALPTQWEQSCKKADARMTARLKARGLIK